MTRRECKRCGEINEHRLRSEAKSDGTYSLKSFCRACENIDNLSRYYALGTNRKRSYKYTLKTKYGLTPEEYIDLFNSQGGECAICNTKLAHKLQDDENSKAVVDHCHASGQVRAILCHDCNAGLGMFKDNSAILAKAIDYLGKKSS